MQPRTEAERELILERLDALGDGAISQQVKVTQTHHSGPLPTSDTLESYENVHEGLAERIVQMAEREQSHSHQKDERDQSLQVRVFNAQKRDVLNGQMAAVLVVAMMLGVIIFAIVEDQPWVASVLGGGTIVALATAFISGRQSND